MIICHFNYQSINYLQCLLFFHTNQAIKTLQSPPLHQTNSQIETKFPTIISQKAPIIFHSLLFHTLFLLLRSIFYLQSIPKNLIFISISLHFLFHFFLLFIFSLYHSFLIQKVNWVCSVEAVTITLFLFPRQFNCYEDNNQLTPSFLFLSFDILNGFLMIVMSDLLMTYYSLLNLKSYSFFFKPLLWR